MRRRLVPLFLSCALLAGVLLPGRARAFRVVWMSDTQNYSGYYHDTYTAMVDWIVEHKEDMDIRLVLHTGDVVSASRSEAQWEFAKETMGSLNGVVPYLVANGNHDVGKKYQFDNFNAYMDTHSIDPLTGGIYGGGRSRYALFSAEGRDYIFLSLSMPASKLPAEEVAWANRILSAYEDRIAVILTHSYLFGRGGRTGHGDDVFENVVRPNPNVWLVLCGHCRGVNYREDEIDDTGDGVPDRTVYAVLANYQGIKGGGLGYMRIIRFFDDYVLFRTYSPYLDEYTYFEKPGQDSLVVPLPE